MPIKMKPARCNMQSGKGEPPAAPSDGCTARMLTPFKTAYEPKFRETPLGR